ncbi:MAG: hypothetical protein LUE27_05570 [Clostridia bacterium]|nr:hypothetical protein [Clostridia bacterium]
MVNLDPSKITVAFDYSSPEAQDVARCLMMLYQTPAGTCPLDRDFGLDCSPVDLPDPAAENEISVEIYEKTETYEPRASISGIAFVAAGDGTLGAEVSISNE